MSNLFKMFMSIFLCCSIYVKITCVHSFFINCNGKLLPNPSFHIFDVIQNMFIFIKFHYLSDGSCFFFHIKLRRHFAYQLINE